MKKKDTEFARFKRFMARMKYQKKLNEQAWKANRAKKKNDKSEG